MESFAKVFYAISTVLFLFESLAHWGNSQWDVYANIFCIGTFSMVIIGLLHRIINILEKKDDKDDK